jgi:hypothetical protein
MVGTVLYLEYNLCAAMGSLYLRPVYCIFHFLHSQSKTQIVSLLSTALHILLLGAISKYNQQCRIVSTLSSVMTPQKNLNFFVMLSFIGLVVMLLAHYHQVTEFNVGYATGLILMCAVLKFLLLLLL